ncbi:aminotransferase class I/II-fold pyridoxal phosphate-dependent enzyme [candidate division KSB1 bacterium]|nr:aminotransferase class I/II-fold pyridoxal phosphate-dependent enzyme [candidate division KSB1 bacterium]
MKKSKITRRTFIQASGMGLASASLFTPGMGAKARVPAAQPAVLGGTPIHEGGWPEWPVWDQQADEKLLLEVMRSGVWSRADKVKEFEEKYAQLMGSKYCLATTHGTTALITSLRMLGIGAGDEVLTTPYTFIATIASILMNQAMPVFVDVDRETFQMDPDKIEEKITDRTKAILPVHILGLPTDMDRIMAIAKKHNLIVVEDACQAWMAEINHKKLGTIGHAGCYSFQNSKHLPIGEGGAIVSDDREFMDRAYSFHNLGRAYGSMTTAVGGNYVIVGSKCRMTEFQAAIGLAQMKRLEQQTERRWENAGYLRSLIQDIPGIMPYRLYDNVTKAVFHLFPFRFDSRQFGGMSQPQMIKALRAEGISCSAGYEPLNTMPYLQDALDSRAFRAIYPQDMLDFEKYKEKNNCPENDRLCQETVWIPQNVLLSEKSKLDDIAEAIRKVSQHSAEIAKQV